MEEIRESCETPQCSVEAMRLNRQTMTVENLIGLDRCIVPELRALWEMGIRTVCSCCGHGLDDRAYIRVEAEDGPKMREMGYEPFEPHECLIHPGTAAFRAKGVKAAREQGFSPDDREIEEIRRMWRTAVGIEERKDNV